MICFRLASLIKKGSPISKESYVLSVASIEERDRWLQALAVNFNPEQTSDTKAGLWSENFVLEEDRNDPKS